MKINGIVACDIDGGIGNNGKIPWHIPEDLQWFKHCTENSIVVMGKNTWNSLPKKLPNRLNVVVSSRPTQDADKSVSGDIGMILKNINAVKHWKDKHANYDTVWVIGGANLFEQSYQYIDHMYLTRIKQSYKCDTTIDLNQLERTFPITEVINSKTDYYFEIRSKNYESIPLFITKYFR